MAKLDRGAKLYSTYLDWPENIFIVCHKCQGYKKAKKLCEKIKKKACKKLCSPTPPITLCSPCFGFCPKDKIAVLCSEKISDKKPKEVKNKKKIKKQLEIIL
jgi:hypothetical protein